MSTMKERMNVRAAAFAEEKLKGNEFIAVSRNQIEEFFKAGFESGVLNVSNEILACLDSRELKL